MNNLFQDETKIKVFAQIKKNLCMLGSNAEEKELDDVINQIPKNFLDQKDDLMTICQIIAYYARCSDTSKKKNTIKLFERLLTKIKTHLQDESSFFWNIFGGLYYFKLWMFNEGLISIDQIIMSGQLDKTGTIFEYFLPEIVENEPEISSIQLW